MLEPNLDKMPTSFSGLYPKLDEDKPNVIMGTWSGLNPSNHCDLLHFKINIVNTMSIGLPKNSPFKSIFGY